VVPILITLPGPYLSWAALPGGMKVLARGLRPGRWDPVKELGVHPVIGGGPMPAYIRRPHDELLRAVLDPKVTASRLVVVRGGSSTGKTRAAYEAVKDRLADWRLDYPLDPGALAARLEAGIPARTVLWLGELRHYFDADGGAAVLGRLADLLEGKRHLAITTVWPEHWAAYTAAARAGPGTADPAGAAGRLLGRLQELTSGDPARIDPARGGVIDVLARFTAAEMADVAGTGDPVLEAAAAVAARAGQEGYVTQYLAGVPDLLDHWGKPSGDPYGPYGQAIITAAMDAALPAVNSAGSRPSSSTIPAALRDRTSAIGSRARFRPDTARRDSCRNTGRAAASGSAAAGGRRPPASGLMISTAITPPTARAPGTSVSRVRRAARCPSRPLMNGCP
jgi:hypothetical protein